jgi:hypothetical protein
MEMMMNQKNELPNTNLIITKQFNFRDILCPCCGGLILFPIVLRHMELLDRLQHRCDHPLVILSGQRCEQHNRSIGAPHHSWHRHFATDIAPNRYEFDSPDHFDSILDDLYREAHALGFRGVGLLTSDDPFTGHLHLDMRPVPQHWRL